MPLKTCNFFTRNYQFNNSQLHPFFPFPPPTLHFYIITHFHNHETFIICYRALRCLRLRTGPTRTDGPSTAGSDWIPSLAAASNERNPIYTGNLRKYTKLFIL